MQQYFQNFYLDLILGEWSVSQNDLQDFIKGQHLESSSARAELLSALFNN